MEILNLIKSKNKYTAIRWNSKNIDDIKKFIIDTNIDIDIDFLNPNDTHLNLIIDSFRHIQVPKNWFIILDNSNKYHNFSSIRSINKEFTRS